MSYVEPHKDMKMELLTTPRVGYEVKRLSVKNSLLGLVRTGWLLFPGRSVVGLVLTYAAFLLTYQLRYTLFNFDDKDFYQIPVTFGEHLEIGLLYTLVMIIVLLSNGYYKANHVSSFLADVFLLIRAALISIAAISLEAALIQPKLSVSRLMILYLLPVTVIVLGMETVLNRRIRHKRWSMGLGVRNLIVVGATDAGMRLMQTVTEKSGLGYKLIGFVDDQLRYSDWTLLPRYGNNVKRANPVVPHLGITSQLTELIKQHRVDEVIIALPAENYQTASKIITECDRQGVSVNLIPAMYDLKLGQTSVREINGLPLLVTDRPAQSGLSFWLKRTIDFVGTLGILLLAAFPMLAIVLAIKLDSKGPVIFRQTRVGKNGKVFTFYKFRSMYVDAESRIGELAAHNETNGATFKMKNDPRVTRIGRFIRRTSLDELPQLFNILAGQMSLVGPRPGLPREVSRYQPWQYRRLEVMPGLTGLWQVSGRSSVTFDEMVKLDIYYAEHWSLLMDLKILIETIRAVIKTEGAY